MEEMKMAVQNGIMIANSDEAISQVTEVKKLVVGLRDEASNYQNTVKDLVEYVGGGFRSYIAASASIVETLAQAADAAEKAATRMNVMVEQQMQLTGDSAAYKLD